MDKRDKAIILEFKKRFSADLKENVKQLIIFGSRVKGEASEYSDLDVIALVDRKTPELEKKLEDIMYQVMWDYDFQPFISLKVFSEAQFYDAINRGFSFYRHVEKEGISV